MTQLLDDRQRTFLRRADALSKLPDNPNFQVLVEEMEAKRQRMEKTLMALAMTDTITAEVLFRQTTYDRGFVDGMRYAVVEVPKGAGRKLARSDAPQAEAGEEEVEDRWA